MPIGKMPDLQSKPIPAFPGLLALLGPGIVWMALAQGSGELIWWPYIIAKYGLGFLFLLIPACLLQYPLTYNVGQYTLLTGESIFQGFMRVSRIYALCLWALLIVAFLWFGAFASAGATALVELTDFPRGWEIAHQRHFWSYSVIAVFFVAVLMSRVIYVLIERVMIVIAIVTFVGLVLACLQADVRPHYGEFLSGIFWPKGGLARPWEAGDTTRLLAAITFAGLGGFWLLFYSYWIREKNVGMAKHFGRITGPITGRPEVIPKSGFIPEENSTMPCRVRRWRRYLLLDSGIGIGGNILTTLMMCLLAFAILFPKGLYPWGDQLAVVQAEFFGNAWGTIGRVIFLLIAAAFLADTWVATADAVARIHTDFVISYFPRTDAITPRVWYIIFFVLLTVLTSITMPLQQPGKLILLSAVIGVVATVAYSFGLVALNLKLRRIMPEAARPTRKATVLLAISAVSYLGLTIAYLIAKYLETANQ